MNNLAVFGGFIYAYCTDFIINLANIFSLSYYEVNFIIFCLIYPVLIFGTLGLYVIQRERVKKIKERYKKNTVQLADSTL
jgi:hypothetical protein